MLDAGIRDDRYASLIPHQTFVEIRRTDPDQYRYLLGERFESAAFGRVGAGAQLTPPAALHRRTHRRTAGACLRLVRAARKPRIRRPGSRAGA